MNAANADGDIRPGKDLGSREFVVSPELVQRYVDILGLDHEWYTGGSPFGGAVAPALVLGSAEGGFEGDHFSNRFGELWVRQEWQFSRPVAPGDGLRVRAVIADVYERRDRIIVATEYSMETQSGRKVARSVHHNSFLRDQTEGELMLPAPSDRRRTPPRPEPIGESIGQLERNITLEMCDVFNAGNENYHTNREAANALGFDDVVVAAGMTTPYISEVMTQRFGAGWLEGGRMDLKFINILKPNEPFTTTGVVTDRTDDGEGVRVHVAVWSEKQDGTKIIVGQASALE